MRRFLLSGEGWPYLLVPFIPLAIVLDVASAPATVVFFVSATGVIPTAALMGKATEELATRSGPGIGGLLNVTFGNVTELVLALLVLKAGKPAVVKASITGSLVSNSLLGLGLAILAVEGVRYARIEGLGSAATLTAVAVNVGIGLLVVLLKAEVLH